MQKRGNPIDPWCGSWIDHDNPQDIGYCWDHNSGYNSGYNTNNSGCIWLYDGIYDHTGWWFQPTPLKNHGVRQLGS